MTEPALSQATTVDALSAQVEEHAVGPCRVLMVKTPVEAVVSWRGAFMAYPDIARGDRLVQGLTVQLLDKGTQRRDRFTLAEELENRGIQIQFSSDVLRVSVQGRALRDDVPTALEIMAEEMRRPLFDAGEFEKTSAQYKAALQRSLDNTASQALVALSQRLYGRAHPNYLWPTRQAIDRLEALSVDQVRAYHRRHFGARDLLLVFVGDVEADAVVQAVRDAFGDWPAPESDPLHETTAAPAEPGRSVVMMPDKQNVDVRMGHALALRRPDPDYIPLHVGNYILGGNFSARLMTRVRDELGLTYGIHARLSGVTADYDGHWVVGVTLSQENVERGLAATRDEVNRFVEEGPTPDEVRDKKTTITGAYKVRMATTGGLASVLYQQAVRGFDVGYLDRFPREVEAVTLPQIRDAMQRHFNPDAFQVALAGMAPESSAAPAEDGV